ncbi:MAG TPA: hypothetical protein PLJ47_10010 [Candidatus Hydrogenedentes bacterium]|nr:hypothetical protein [Candidatus Hydrogenedentota bacterium]
MKKRFLLALVALGVMSGCAGTGMSDAAPFEDPNGNFHLRVYVDSMHYAGVPVDIKVWIDGDLAVSRNFSSKRGHYNDQFRFSLPPGTHEIRAKTIKGNTEIARTFEVKDRLFGALYFSPKQKGLPPEFSFSVSPEPIYVAPGQGGV